MGSSWPSDQFFGVLDCPVELVGGQPMLLSELREGLASRFGASVGGTLLIFWFMTNFYNYREFANRLLYSRDRLRYRAFNRSLMNLRHLTAHKHVAVAQPFQEIFERSSNAMWCLEENSDAINVLESLEPQ